MAADAEGAYVHADENILDHSGSGAYILHIDGRTGTEVWRTPAERLGSASLEAGTLLVTNEVWTKARGLSSVTEPPKPATEERLKTGHFR